VPPPLPPAVEAATGAAERNRASYMDSPDAEVAELMATSLGAATQDGGDGARGYKLLHALVNDETHATMFLAMRTDSSVVVVTDDGVSEVETPASYKKMLLSKEREKWLESMAVEVDTFKEVNVYRLIPRSDVPEGATVFQLHWKFKLKRKQDRSLDKYKSRCVIMGNRMSKGKDYSESFAAGARMVSIRLVFVIAAVYDLIDFITDVKGAYLHASKPKEGIGSVTYVWQPPGFEEFGPNGEKMVGVLNQYVYGDPGAARAWAKRFDTFLKSIGASFTDVDVNLGRIDHALGFIIYAKYVDEVVGAGSTDAVITWFQTAIDAEFPGCTHGPWDTVLGFGVTRNRVNRTVSVNATKLIRDLVGRHDASTAS